MSNAIVMREGSSAAMIRKVMTSIFRFTAAPVMALVMLSGAALADEPKVLGRYKAWSAFTMNQGGEKVCFIVSEPRSKRLSRRGRSRGDVFFLVSHFQTGDKKITGQPSVIIGYPFGRNTTPTIRIGSDRFNMVLDSNNEENRTRAWIDDASTETRLLASMRRGANMVVTGRSASGTVSTDTYSLLGFTAALERIDRECN